MREINLKKITSLKSQSSNSSGIFTRHPQPEEVASVNANNKLNFSEKKFSFTSKFCEWVINFSLVMLFLGLPLFFTGLSFQGLAFEKQIYFYFWIFLALVFWAVKSVSEEEMRIRRTPLDIPVLFFLLVAIFSSFFSVDHWHSFWGYFSDPSRGVGSIIAITIAYYLLFSIQSSKRIKIIAFVLFISNIIVSTWSLLSVLNINPIQEKFAQFAPINPIGSFSGLAVFLAMMMPILLSILININQTFGNSLLRITSSVFVSFAIFLNLVLFLAIYSFISWWGWMVMIFGIVIFLVFTISGIVKSVDSLWGWVPAAVFVGMMVIFIGGESIRIAKINLPIEIYPTYNLSFDIAKKALSEKLFLGSGPATYGYNFSLFRGKEYNESDLYSLRFFQGTGLLAEIPATMGALGLIALVLTGLSFVGTGFYVLSSNKKRSNIYSLGFFISSLIFVFSAIALRVDGAAFLIGMLISSFALATVVKEGDGNEKYIHFSLKSSPKFALAMAFIFMLISASVIFIFVFIGKVYVADIYVGKSVRAPRVSEDSLKYISRAMELYKLESRYYAQAANYLFVLANEAAASEDKKGSVAGYLESSIKMASEAARLSGNDINAIESLAQISENSVAYVGSSIEESLKFAENNYKLALQLEPNNPNFYLKLGQLKIASASTKKDEGEIKSNLSESEDYFKKSLEEKKNFDPGYYNLALVQERLGKLDEAIENGINANRYQKNNINYVFYLAHLYDIRGKEGDLEMAKEIFEISAKMNEMEILPHFRLALISEKMKDGENAIKEYEKAISLLSSDREDERKKIQEAIDNVRSGVGNLSAPDQKIPTLEGQRSEVDNMSDENKEQIEQ